MPEPLEDFAPTVTRDPLIGIQLGEYRVLSRLGEGAMGVVYRGEQPVLGKPVAIKVMKSSFSAEPSYVKKLLEEAQAISAARHPNIIDIFSFGQAPTGQQYFVMECLEGEPLDVHLSQRGALPVDEVLKLLQQISAGLSAAHAAGVVHRDLKPSNIFLAKLGDGTRFVKLLDFGLAKRTAPNSGVRPTANVIVGTALWMAPEQATTEEVGPWTDLYAMGCIAHELLTGSPPFVAGSIIEVIHQHMTATPRPLRQIDPNIPEPLEALVLELLQKKPANRPKSAAIVRKSLDRIDRQTAASRTRATGLKPLAPIPAYERATTLATRMGSAPPRSSKTWVLALLAVLAPLLGVGGYFVAKKLDAPTVVEPIVEPTELVPPPPLVVTPSRPAPVTVPVAAPVSPRPRPRAAHTEQDVTARIQRMRQQADTKFGESADGRRVSKELTDYWQDLMDKRASPDELWKDLEKYEAAGFRIR